MEKQTTGTATPQRESRIGAVENRLDRVHGQIDDLMEKVGDLGVGYRDLLETFLDQGRTDRGDRGYEQVESGHRRHSLAHVEERLDEALDKLRYLQQTTEEGLEAQREVYEELLPDL